MISERTLVRIGVGAIALHVVDDSFLQPQPGTSATDHLVSGFVPLIGLAVPAVIYPRLRAGWRAVAALAIWRVRTGKTQAKRPQTQRVAGASTPEHRR